MKKLSRIVITPSRLLLFFFTAAAPLGAQVYQVYFGDLHGHSTLSFDTGSSAKAPAAAFAHARDVANLDFYAITDHGNELNNGQPLIGWQSLQDAATATTGATFVALGSQEVGLVFGTGGYGHVVIHDSPDLADNDVYPDVRFDLDDMYNFLKVRNSLAHFCHPGIQGQSDDASSRFNSFAYDAEADLQMYGLEVLSGFRSDPYENYYLQALANGWHVGAVAGQDNHGSTYGNRVDGEGTINLTGVLLDTLNRTNVLAAFRNQRTYAARTRPAGDRLYLTRFTADGHWMGEQFDNDDNIVAFEIAAHAQAKFMSAQLYKNGQILDRINPDSNSFVWTPADSAAEGNAYYFVKLVQEDTDMLWSSPIWISSPGANTGPETIITSISELKGNNAAGLPLALGVTNVTLRGTVTVANQFGGSGPGYLQDSTGGISVFGETFIKSVIPGIPLEMEVTGSVSFYNGLTEIRPFRVKRVKVNQNFPDPIILTTGEIAGNGEAYEGLLARIEGVTISGNFPASGSNANLNINDGSGQVTLRIDKDTDIDGQAKPQGVVSIVGVIGQFDTTPPYSSGYQVSPRSMADFSISTQVTDSAHERVPDEMALAQNYPNPFNGETLIGFRHLGPAPVSLSIFDLRGRQVRVVFDGSLAPGRHQLTWDGRDDRGVVQGSGIYFYRLVSGETVITRKMILLD